ncbi:MAG: family 43 glycosylhydrolase, partial [Bacteroidota bacterium]
LPPKDQAALGAKIALLTDDMKEFAEAPREVVILDENGHPLLEGDNDRRYFEGPWMHKYKDTYYFSYSTGDTHYICYATADNPYGPFTYQGRILNPVIGWTTHHSICEIEGKWYLFYHDSVLSEGVTHLRSIKMTELKYDENGKIITIDPYKE